MSWLSALGGFDNIYSYVLFLQSQCEHQEKESLTWVVEAIVTSWLSAMGGGGGRSSAVGKAAAVALVLDSVGQCTDQ